MPPHHSTFFMTAAQKDIVKSTWQTAATLEDKAIGALFYDRLFCVAHEVRALFLNTVPEQAKKLMAMLRYLVCNMDRPAEISSTVSALANRHAGYKVKAYQYAVVGNALLWTLQKSLGPLWSEEVEDAWASFYAQVSEAMMGAHPSPKATAPSRGRVSTFHF